MTEGTFETDCDEIQVAGLDREKIVLSVAKVRESDETENEWQPDIRIELPKEMALKAGLPEKIFELDDFHYKEYVGKNLSALLGLVGYGKKLNLQMFLSPSEEG